MNDPKITQDQPSTPAPPTFASDADADRRCQGRWQACQAVPERDFGMPSRDRVRAALAKQDPTGLDADESSLYDRCNQQEIDMSAELFGADVSKSVVLREVPWGVRISPDRIPHVGRPDFARRLGTRLLIVEYKTGDRETAASPANEHLRDLAVLGRGNLAGVTDVAVAIIQPALSDRPVGSLYTEPDLARAEKEMFLRVLASHAPGAPRTAGESQCRDCRARHGCPEYQRWASALVPAAQLLVAIPVSQWTPAQLAQFLEAAAAAAQWIQETLTEILSQSPRA